MLNLLPLYSLPSQLSVCAMQCVCWAERVLGKQLAGTDKTRQVGKAGKQVGQAKTETQHRVLL